MSIKKIYRGEITWESNGEEDRLLGLYCKRKHESCILAEKIKDDMFMHGRYLTVRYWLSREPMRRCEAMEQYALKLLGDADVDYGMAYSDCTGYLWTDEEIKVGGHDLLNELKDKIGMFLILEIDYDRQPKK